MATSAPLKIAIFGAGGIGSVVGGCLADAGHDITFIDPWFEHIAAIQEKGLLVKFASGPEYKSTPRACQLKDLQNLQYESFDMGFIAVNAYDTDWATMCLDRFIKRTGKMCCFQNGINDERVAAVAGQSRTLGVIMTISAAVYEPGVALRTDLNPHAFKVGELDGRDTPAARHLASMLECVGPSCITLDLWGQRWSKLMLNAMNNALAGLTGWKTIKCRTHHDTQRIGIQLAAEAVRVARAHGRNITEVLGLQAEDILEAAEGRNLATAQAQLGQVAASAGGESRPSFGQDVIKGRRTEIDELNGLVARMGREKGVSTPFCDAIVSLVHTLGVGFTPEPKHIEPLIAMLPEAQKPAELALSDSASRKRARVEETAPAAVVTGSGRSVALITGAGSGIGLAVALRLAAGGWQRAGTAIALVLCGRRREPLQQTAELCRKAGGGDVLVVPADVTKEADVCTVFSTIRHEYGRLDVVFNNAGVNLPFTPVDELRLSDWMWLQGINVTGAFLVAREAFKLMKAQSPQGGRIINNGSISSETPRPGGAAYTVSKHAITGLTKSLALDGRSCQIACGQIDFGNVLSAMATADANGMRPMLQADGSTKPEPLMGAEDAANAVHYMASLPLGANVLSMTVMATHMPFVGRG